MIVLSYSQRLQLMLVYFKLVMVKSPAKLLKKCEGRDALSDILQRHVGAINYSLHTGRERARTNLFVFTEEFQWKPLPSEKNFFAATSCPNSVWFDFVWPVRATKWCGADQDFHENSQSVHSNRFQAASTRRRNLLLQLLSYYSPILGKI